MAERTEGDIILKDKIIDRIVSYRLKSGLSQAEFAKNHNIDRQTVNRWESKKSDRGVTIYTIQRFCDMIGISLAEFFDAESFNKKT